MSNIKFKSADNFTTVISINLPDCFRLYGGPFYTAHSRFQG